MGNLTKLLILRNNNRINSSHMAIRSNTLNSRECIRSKTTKTRVIARTSNRAALALLVLLGWEWVSAAALIAYFNPATTENCLLY
jgi:hypothetical protein